MAVLPRCREGQFGLFTAAQANAAGLSRHGLAALASSGSIVRIARGVYVAAEDVVRQTSRERSLRLAVALCLARPHSVVSHHSASLVHGLPFLHSYPARPSLTIDSTRAKGGGRRPNAYLHRAALPPHHVDQRGDWAVTTTGRTVCDVARRGGTLAGLVALDSALHVGSARLSDVATIASECSGWPGATSLPRMIERASGHAESPAETIARWQLTELGFRPTPQVWAYDDRGEIGCGDLWLSGQWVFVEIDGDVKYGSNAQPTTLIEEKRRQERLEAAGFGVARIAARSAHDARQLDTRVRRAAAAAELARRTRDVSGFVASPPTWATRGTAIPTSLAPRC